MEKHTCFSFFGDSKFPVYYTQAGFLCGVFFKEVCVKLGDVPAKNYVNIF